MTADFSEVRTLSSFVPAERWQKSRKIYLPSFNNFQFQRNAENIKKVGYQELTFFDNRKQNTKI